LLSFWKCSFGVEATTITVEVNIDKGIGYHLVGLPDNAISKYRIAAALKTMAMVCQVKDLIIWQLILRKEGSAYDLTLTIGILVASAKSLQ
jgi:magnesium chelatase family protein